MISSLWQYVSSISFWHLVLIAYAIASAGFWPGFALMERSGRTGTIGTSLMLIGSTISAGTSVVVIVRLIGMIPVALRKIQLSPSLSAAVLFIFVVVSILGVALFFFRTYFIRQYGLAEVIFALGSIWTSVSSLIHGQVGAPAWFSVVAAAYLLVRGLDNAILGTVKEENRLKLAELMAAFRQFGKLKPGHAPDHV